jgi:hypothetical protein
MPNDQDPSSGAPPPPPGKPRRRPAPMIELEATEVENKPVADAAGKAASEPAAAATTPDAPPSPPSQPAPASEPPAAEQGPPPEPPPAAATADASASAAPRKTSTAWRLIGAGVAVLAAVLIALLGANFAAGYLGASALEARLARLEQQLREVAARPLAPDADRRPFDELAGRLTRLEAALANPRPGALDPAVANRLAILEGEVKAMAETVSILGRRSDDIAVTAREARSRVDTLNAALAELSQKVNRLGAPAVERRELEALTSRVDAVERGEKAVEAELAKRTDSGDRPLRLAVVAATLKGAVERGDPFAAELAAAKALAPDPKTLAPLDAFAAAGVPTVVALARELSALAPALYSAAGAPAREGGFLDKLQASAEKLVRVRPAEEIAGADPAAVVSRAEAKAARADLAGALAELAALPAAARAPAEPWIKQAQARAAALEASRRLAADALVALGK